MLCGDTLATYAGIEFVGLIQHEQPCHQDMHGFMDAVDAEQFCLVDVDGATMQMDGINFCNFTFQQKCAEASNAESNCIRCDIGNTSRCANRHSYLFRYQAAKWKHCLDSSHLDLPC